MDPILGMLSTKEPISGERLCEQLGMTRAAVWKRMEKLRAEGYRIVSAGKLGPGGKQPAARLPPA